VECAEEFLRQPYLGLGGKVATTDNERRTGREKQVKLDNEEFRRRQARTLKTKTPRRLQSGRFISFCFYVFTFCDEEAEDRINRP
jgi:hypothetical protein